MAGHSEGPATATAWLTPQDTCAFRCVVHATRIARTQSTVRTALRRWLRSWNRAAVGAAIGTWLGPTGSNRCALLPQVTARVLSRLCKSSRRGQQRPVKEHVWFGFFLTSFF